MADNKVRLLSIGNGAYFVKTMQLPGGIVGSGADNIALGNAKRDHSEHTFVDIGCGACQRSVRKPCHTAGQKRL